MIGILGGTFDPIHLGHLRTGLEVYEALRLREVRFIPCRNPPHRDTPQSETHHRLAMVQAAIADQAGLVCDEREVNREGPSYTVDTLAGIRTEVGDEALALIVGADAFADINTWHDWERLIELAHLIVVHRPGWVAGIPTAARALLADRVTENRAVLDAKSAGCVWFQVVTPLQISATAIREAVSKGRSIRFLVPDTVERYIHEQGLYAH